MNAVLAIPLSAVTVKDSERCQGQDMYSRKQRHFFSAKQQVVCVLLHNTLDRARKPAPCHCELWVHDKRFTNFSSWRPILGPRQGSGRGRGRIALCR